MRAKRQTSQNRQEPLRRGLLLHKYRIETRLGHGAFSEVYRAYDTIEGVRVALKVFRSLPGASEGMFRNEVRIISRLDHPNLMRMKTAEIVDRRLILVTELSDRTLADLYTRPHPTRYSLQIFDKILQGLAYAHHHGVVHRDVKPQNILVWRDGRVKITDFGISKLIQRPLTHTTAVGTPSYRAPEQAYGRPTFASDIFSAALLFYEMITRVLPRWPFRWPFDRHDLFVGRVPPELIPVIRRAASFDLEKRYRDGAALLRAVHAAVPELRHHETRQRSAHARPLGWRQYRMRQFEHKYERRLHLDYRCNRCSGAISEFMRACPWCGYQRNSFARITAFPSLCRRCEHGVHADWRYCPWCYGPGFKRVALIPSHDRRYAGRCPRCRDTRLLPHMRFCPWCNARLRAWRARGLEGRCPACQASVSSDCWDFCAWCGKNLQWLKRSRHSRTGG